MSACDLQMPNFAKGTVQKTGRDIVAVVVASSSSFSFSSWAFTLPPSTIDAMIFLDNITNKNHSGPLTTHEKNSIYNLLCIITPVKKTIRPQPLEETNSIQLFPQEKYA